MSDLSTKDCDILTGPQLSDCHTLPDSANGRVTDSKILYPFVSVHVRFLTVLRAVNAFCVRYYAFCPVVSFGKF